MMKIADLSPETLEKLKQVRYDRIVEKHEGPWDYAGDFNYGEPEFIQVEGRDVLLPIEKSNHPNITILRVAPGEDGKTLTLFLRDTTYYPDDEFSDFSSGYMAFCERFLNENFYVATVYHEWFILRNEVLNSN